MRMGAACPLAEKLVRRAEKKVEEAERKLKEKKEECERLKAKLAYERFGGNRLEFEMRTVKMMKSLKAASGNDAVSKFKQNMKDRNLWEDWKRARDHYCVFPTEDSLRKRYYRRHTKVA